MFSDLTVPYAICRWWVFAYFDSLYRDIKINDHVTMIENFDE